MAVEVPAIAAAGLVKDFGATRALDGFDLEVARGSVCGLLGPNGAGKTTAVRILATLLRSDGGQAWIDGIEVGADPMAVRRRIGWSGQSPAVDEILSGRQNLVLFGRLNRLSVAAARTRADELLVQLDLAEAAGKSVKHYSGGMRRRLDLAATLILTPSVLFLDEPTTGLDPRSRNEVWSSIRALVAGGTTVLLTTQYLDEADQLADRIVVIDRGRTIAEGPPDALKAQVGGDRLDVVVAAAGDVAMAACLVARIAGAEPDVDREARRLSAPVIDRVAALTDVLHALSADGIDVIDVGIRRPTLDDVFLGLTGHKAAAVMGALERLRWAMRDGWIIAVRDMQQWVREPQMIVWGLLFPIMFVLLFAYVFGSGMIVPGGGNYREFLMAGMFAQTMAFGIGETAMAVQVDSAKGVMDRFRSMPMAPSAVVVGRCLAAMVYSAISLAILVATGLAIGWRWHGSLGEAVAAFGLLLLLRMAFLWLGILLGLKARNAESVNSLYGLLYPVTMLSSAFIAVELMPAWLGAIATWNPLSATINATRDLFGNPGVETAGWVADNSLLLAIVWPVVITAVTLPFAVRAYQRLSR